jgi:hypothetical protein
MVATSASLSAPALFYFGSILFCVRDCGPSGLGTRAGLSGWLRASTMKGVTDEGNGIRRELCAGAFGGDGIGSAESGKSWC